MRLADLLADPMARAEALARCCSDAGVPMAQPFPIRPLSAKYPEPKIHQQRENTAPAAKERKEGAVKRHEERTHGS